MESDDSMVCSMDGAVGISVGTRSVVGAADPLHDIANRLKMIKHTTQNSWIGLLIVDSSIFHPRDIYSLSKYAINDNTISLDSLSVRNWHHVSTSN